MLQDRLELSERRACRVTGQHRSTQRRLPARGRGDDALRTELHAFSRGHHRWGVPPGVGDVAGSAVGVRKIDSRAQLLRPYASPKDLD